MVQAIAVGLAEGVEFSRYHPLRRNCCSYAERLLDKVVLDGESFEGLASYARPILPFHFGLLHVL